MTDASDAEHSIDSISKHPQNGQQAYQLCVQSRQTVINRVNAAAQPAGDVLNHTQQAARMGQYSMQPSV